MRSGQGTRSSAAMSATWRRLPPPAAHAWLGFGPGLRGVRVRAAGRSNPLTGVAVGTGAGGLVAAAVPGGGHGGGTRRVVIHATATGGMPGWQIALIAAAVLASAVAAVLLARARAARRRTAASPA